MDLLYVSIEKKHINIVRPPTDGSGVRGSKDNNGSDNQNGWDSRTAEIPEEIRNDLSGHPDFLAEFMSDVIKDDQSSEQKIILFLDTHFGFFKEYIYRNTGRDMADRLFYIENDKLKRSKDSSNICQRLDYTAESGTKMAKSAIYGVDDTFFRKLIKELSKNRIKVIYATSSLVVYGRTFLNTAEGSEDILYGYSRFIGLDIREKLIRAVVIDDGDLIHMEEVRLPDVIAPEDMNMTDVLTDFIRDHGTDISEETLVMISGTGNIDTEAKRLGRYSGVKCIPVNKVAGVPLNVYPLTGLDRVKHREENYLYGGMPKRRFSRATSRMCFAAGLVLVLLFSILPFYDLYSGSRNTKLNEEISRIGYADKLELINENRDIQSRLQIFKDDRDMIVGDRVNYSEVLGNLHKDLLIDAEINDLLFDEESGLIIDFDLSSDNVNKYENARDRINDERKYFIVESSVEPLGTGYNYTIKVTVLV